MMAMLMHCAHLRPFDDSWVGLESITGILQSTSLQGYIRCAVLLEVIQQPEQTSPDGLLALFCFVDVDHHKDVNHTPPATGKHAHIDTTEILNQIDGKVAVFGEYTDVVHADHQGVHGILFFPCQRRQFLWRKFIVKFQRADREPSVHQWIVHVSSEISPNFIATVFIPVLHLTKAEQEREQNGNTADGLPNIRCGLNVHR